jgi:tRNA(Ile)-lysidine synthetase-like protein
MLGIPLLSDAAAVGGVAREASATGSGTEAAARSLRYAFFSQVARVTGATLLCTGHTEDDQVETIAMALGRGADAIGLSGMPSRRKLDDGLVLLRPLIGTSRSDIREYLTERRIAWSEDPSNTDLRYARNRMRHVVLPELVRSEPGIRERILRLGADAGRLRADASAEAQLLSWQIDDRDPDVSTLPAASLLSASREARLLALFTEAGRRGMIRAASRIPVRFFQPLLEKTIALGTLIQGRGCRITRSGAVLRWGPDIVRGTEYGYLRSVEPGARVELPSGHRISTYLEQKEVTESPPGVVELNQVRLPVVVRSRRIGDVLATQAGHKTVAAVLSEQGIPVDSRMRVPVICDREGVLAVLAGDEPQGRDVVAYRPESSGATCRLMVARASARR